MRQRPISCLALLVFLLLMFFPAKFFYQPLPVKEKCEAQIVGRVCRTVQNQKKEKMQIELQNCRVRNGNQEFQVQKLILYLDVQKDFPIGTELSLSGTIYPIEEPTNPGQFNSKLYYQGKGISYTVYADKVREVGFHPSHFQEGLLNLQRQMKKVYKEVYNERDSGLLCAMVLGEKQELSVETKDFYQKNGISHLLAISGLHISLLGMGLYRILKRLTGSCFVAGIPSAFFIWSYCWMTGGSLSATRAASMCSLAILADLVGRSYDMLTAIGISALVMMLFNPLSAKQSAFLLSFGAVLAIALLQPFWQLYCKKMGRLLQSFSVSFSVLLLTFPLLIRSFYTYSLYSTLLNLMVIPLMSILMIFGILCGIAGFWSFPLAKIVGLPCHLIFNFYDWLGRLCLSLPASVLTIGNPKTWKILLYYIALSVGIFLLYREKRRKKYWMKQTPFRPQKKVLGWSLGMVFACTLLLCTRVSYGLDISMLDVGQGDSVFFRTPSGTTFLMDGGSNNVSQVGNYRILPYLQAEGVKTLDYLMISHMDQDHISGLKELLEVEKNTGTIKIGHAVLPKLDQKDEAYQEMEILLSDRDIPILYMKTGDCLVDRKTGFSLTCLWPQDKEISDDRNDLSLVLLAEFQEFQMLFTGDIGKETEEKLCLSGLLTPVEVLKTAHHGSRHSSTEEFLRQICPRVSLISCSATNRYGHPGEETLKRLTDVGSKIWMTKDLGAIQIWTDGHQVRVKSYQK